MVILLYTDHKLTQTTPGHGAFTSIEKYLASD